VLNLSDGKEELELLTSKSWSAGEGATSFFTTTAIISLRGRSVDPAIYGLL